MSVKQTPLKSGVIFTVTIQVHRGGAGRGVRTRIRGSAGPDPPASNRNIRDSRKSGDVLLWVGGWAGKSTTVHWHIVHVWCVETWASNECRSHAWPRRPILSYHDWTEVLTVTRQLLVTKVQFWIAFMFQHYFRLIYCASCPRNDVCCCWRRIAKSSCGGWRCSVNEAFQNAPKCTI